jgi:tetratricopeptide (TPR) repeat protein
MNLFTIAFFCIQSTLPGESLYLQAHQAEQQGRYADALGLYLQSAEADPELAPYAKIRAALSRGTAGDPQGAIRELHSILASQSEGPWMPFGAYQLAALYTKQNLHEKAMPFWAQAAATDRNLWWQVDIRWKQAKNLLEVPDQKLDGYTFFRDQAQHSIWFQKRIDAARELKDSPRAEDRIVAALALVRSRKIEEGAKLAATIPSTWITTDNLKAQLQYLNARLLIARGKYADGQRILNQLAKDHPKSNWTQQAMEIAVLSFLKAENFDNAEVLVNQMLKLGFSDPDSTVYAMNRLARDYDDIVNRGKAIQWYTEIIKRYPSHKTALSAQLNLANLYRKNNQSDKALDAYAAIIAKHPYTPEATESAFHSGMIHHEAKNKKEAKDSMHLAVKYGFTEYLGYRAQDKLNEWGEPGMRSIPKIQTTPKQRIVMPIPKERGDIPFALDAYGDDPRYARIRFFSSHGMEEAEWETLAMGKSLETHAEPDLLYRAMGEAGTAYTTMQMADRIGLGQLDGGGQTAERMRIRYPRVYWKEVVALGNELELDPFLILSVARQESTYRPNLTSVSGARGVMQLMPDTASWLGRIDDRISAAQATHLSTPQNALRIGAVYLKRLMLRSDHNLVYALASYNAGPGNCDKWRRRFGEIPPDEFIEKIPFGETKNYVKRILAHYATYHSLYTNK